MCKCVEYLVEYDKMDTRFTVGASYYSLRFGKGRHLGQRPGLQSATLTSYFYKNNY
jgi:hypothetical protein